MQTASQTFSVRDDGMAARAVCAPDIHDHAVALRAEDCGRAAEVAQPLKAVKVLRSNRQTRPRRWTPSTDLLHHGVHLCPNSRIAKPRPSGAGGTVDRRAIDRCTDALVTEDLHHDTPPVLLCHSDPDPLTRDQVCSCGIESLHENIVSQGRVEPFAHLVKQGER